MIGCGVWKAVLKIVSVISRQLIVAITHHESGIPLPDNVI